MRAQQIDVRSFQLGQTGISKEEEALARAERDLARALRAERVTEAHEAAMSRADALEVASGERSFLAKAFAGAGALVGGITASVTAALSAPVLGIVSAVASVAWTTVGSGLLNAGFGHAGAGVANLDDQASAARLELDEGVAEVDIERHGKAATDATDAIAESRERVERAERFAREVREARRQLQAIQS